MWANVGRSFLKGSGLRKAFRVGDDCSGRAPVTQVCLRVSALIPLWMFYLWCLCFSCCFLHGSMAISSLQSHKVSVYFLCFLYCFSCCSGARQLLPLHFCLASYCFVLLLHFSLFITFLLSLLLFCFSYCISAFVLQFCRKRFSAGAAPSHCSSPSLCLDQHCSSPQRNRQPTKKPEPYLCWAAGPSRRKA